MNVINGPCDIITRLRWSHYVSGLNQNNRVWMITSATNASFIYILGMYQGNFIFPPESTNPILNVSSENPSVFILKLKLDGTYSSFSILGTYTQPNPFFPNGQMLIGDGDSIYLSINFRSTFVTTFGQMTIPRTSRGNILMIFKMRLNQSATTVPIGTTAIALVWAKTITTSGGGNFPRIALNRSFSLLYFCGSYIDSVTIDNTILTVVVQDFPQPISGYYGIMNTSNGNINLLSQIRSRFSSSLYSIGVANNDNFVISGTFWKDLRVGTQTLTNSKNVLQMFVCKLNANGTVVWLVQPPIGTPPFPNLLTQGNFPYDLAIDGSNNIYVTGTMQVNTTLGNTNIIAENGKNFITKLNTNGDFLWGRAISRFIPQISREFTQVIVGTNGQIFCTGHFVHRARFEESVNGSTIIQKELIGSGSYDLYVASISSNGSWNWCTSVSCVLDQDGSPSLSRDNSSNLYIVGTNPLSDINRGGFILSIKTV